MRRCQIESAQDSRRQRNMLAVRAGVLSLTACAACTCCSSSLVSTVWSFLCSGSGARRCALLAYPRVALCLCQLLFAKCGCAAAALPSPQLRV